MVICACKSNELFKPVSFDVHARATLLEIFLKSHVSRFDMYFFLFHTPQRPRSILYCYGVNIPTNAAFTRSMSYCDVGLQPYVTISHWTETGPGTTSKLSPQEQAKM